MAGEDGGSDDELVIFSRKDDQRAFEDRKKTEIVEGGSSKSDKSWDDLKARREMQIRKYSHMRMVCSAAMYSVLVADIASLNFMLWVRYVVVVN
jgi:hypothetical protein